MNNTSYRSIKSAPEFPDMLYFMLMNRDAQPPISVPAMSMYTRNRMIMAGMAARAHLIMNMTIEPNGISKSITCTRCGGVGAGRGNVGGAAVAGAGGGVDGVDGWPGALM